MKHAAKFMEALRRLSRPAGYVKVRSFTLGARGLGRRFLSLCEGADRRLPGLRAARVIACVGVIACACAFLPAAAAARPPYVMPTLAVTNPAAGTVDLDWAHLPPSSYVILWQCFPGLGCFDTLRPSGGHLELDNVAAGQHSYQVCAPADPYDVCTPLVWAAIS